MIVKYNNILKKLTKVMFQVQIGRATTHNFNDIMSIIIYVLWHI